MLKNASLPISDLPESLSNFFVANFESQIVGIAGLEMFGKIGLLRSVAVDPAFQKKGIAEKLLQKIKRHAEESGIEDIYLITNTADQYFLRQGFHPITRAQAPEAIQQTAQFSGLCPASSFVMKHAL
ncbi:GNAT family N-acetyltransferase [Dyadobacter luticola]|uniref:GNAT family N-acetyltransferase n=1 Tax=Dyadobacter luticola TaxID=1979387 RepID=A0A5R9L617_9BACT|nr:GNAT family N-acetyltransferase [Dyadobacter luticola]